MSKDEVRKVVMIIICIYLGYIGVNLLRDYDPSKNAIYLISGIVFVAFGAASAIHYIRGFIALRRQAAEAAEKARSEDGGEAEAESEASAGTETETPAEEERQDE